MAQQVGSDKQHPQHTLGHGLNSNTVGHTHTNTHTETHQAPDTGLFADTLWLQAQAPTGGLLTRAAIPCT